REAARMGISAAADRRSLLALLDVLATAACETQPTVPGGSEVVSLLLEPASLALSVGEVIRLDAVPVNRGGRILAAGPVRWESSDPAVAEVDSLGLVRGRTEGTARITADVHGVTGDAEITVTSAPVSEWREHSCFVDTSARAWCRGRGQ